MKTHNPKLITEATFKKVIQASMGRYYREQLSQNIKNGLKRKNGLKTQLKTNNKQK